MKCLGNSKQFVAAVSSKFKWKPQTPRTRYSGGGGIYKRRSGVATKGTPYRAPDNCTLPNNRKEKSFLVEMAWYACFWMLDCQTNSRMKQYWWQYIYKTDLSSKQLTALHMNYGMDQSQVSSTSKCLDAKPSFSVENVHSWTIMPVNEY